MYLLISTKIGIKTIIWSINVLFFIVYKFINTMWISRLIVYISMSCVFITCLYSQSDIVEWSELSVDDENLAALFEQYEELSEIAENPFNFNTLTKEQLEQLPFLSDKMIENILYYVYKYGPVVSKKELLGVEGMDWQTRKFLEHFIYIGPAKEEDEKFSFKRMIKYNRQELTTRVDIPLNQKAGYADYPENVLIDSPNKKYYGSPFYNNVRYRFEYDKQVYFGLTAEKDSGEPFFRLYNRKGYDFYSAYLYLQDVGRFKSLAFGNYKASFGYGLVMNMGFSMGKYTSSSSLRRTGQGISKYTSTAEYNYLRGVAATYRLAKRWDATLFYSFRNMDARVENKFIRSLKTDGYHRLYKDMEKKNTASNHMIGSNLTYNGKNVEYGLTAVYNCFDKVLNPDYQPYNHYYPRGKDFFNAGVFYKFFLNKLMISGETAVDKGGAIATINSVCYSPTVDTDITLINRYYDKKYQSIYASSFGENSRTQNETGVYLCLETSAIQNTKLLCYVDYFYFPWKRYRVDMAGTSGIEGVCQLSYSHSNSLSMLIKYSVKNKAQNYSADDGQKYVLPYIRHRARYQVNYLMNDNNSVKVLADYTNTGYWGQGTTNGFLLSATANLGHEAFPVKASVSGAWFSTDDYNSRVYLYEPGLLYAFSMSSFYGKGTRAALKLQYNFRKFLMFQAKFGWTHYTDRNTISSGTEEIQGNNKADIQFQLRIKW